MPIAAGIQTIGSLIGTSMANKANMRIAQMNNEFNERMLQKQMDYNTQMWEKENEYNSAANQKKRLQEAGLNPYLTMSGANAGTAGSVGGVNPPTASPVTAQAPDFSGIGNLVQQYLALKEQKRVNDANIDHVNADARLKATQQMTTLLDAFTNARTGEARAKLDDTINETQKMMQGINYRTAEQRLEQDRVNTLLLSKELSTFDDRNKIALAEQISRTLSNLENMKYTKQQRIHEIQKMFKTHAETQGLKISNDVSKRSAEAIIDKYYNDEYWSRYSSNPWQMGQEVVQTRGASYK